ncbi:HD domain-containing protein [Lujinxingia sediminis]|nr:HD domain-containing protein [Lujinxingia sediminis]
MRPKLFRDPIHDIISLDLSDEAESLLFDLMRTSTVQRLRRVKQLGLASLVYQGAEHSRFAHSMGVAHIARRMVASLPMEVDTRTRQEVFAAALLHDVGHGPFSHAIEKVTGVNHEQFTREAILDEEGEVFRILAAVDPELPRDVARYFEPREGFDPGRQVFRDIVSSQLDADRQDYILRDGHATGVKIGVYDFERILATLKVYESKGAGAKTVRRLAVSYRAREAVEDYLIARFHMFKQVYLHKTVRAAEKMLEAVLRRAGERYAAGERWGGLDDRHPLLRLLGGEALSTREYLQVDDTDVWMMLKVWQRGDDEVLARLSEGLLNRELYKTVDLPPGDPVLVARILDRAAEVAREQGLKVDYAVLVDRARDTPYRPYDPSHPRLSAHIPVVERDGGVVPIEQGSDFVHLLGRDTYNTVRLCVPGSVRRVLLEREVGARRLVDEVE